MAKRNNAEDIFNGGWLMIKNLLRNEVLEKDFIKAIDLFNKNDLSSSYNILFGLWKNTQRPNRKLFFQALLKANAALQLLEQKKFCGAKRVYLSALKNLLNFNGLTKPLNINLFCSEMVSYFENVYANHDSKFGFESIDVELISRPKIRHSISLKKNYSRLRKEIDYWQSCKL